MKTAYSEGNTFSASSFARLSDEKRASFRGKLECEGCGADAHFRKKSIIGQKAHFAAHHHDHCALLEEETTSGKVGKPNDALTSKTLGARIVIRAGIVTSQKNKARSELSVHSGVRYTNSGTGKTKASGSTSQLGLNSILTKLIQDPDFSQSNRIVQFGDFPELPASEFFVSMADTKLEQMRGERRGFWGRIVSTGSGPSGLWLNNGDDDGPNLWIPTELVAEAEDRFGFARSLERKTTMVLALGQLDRTPRAKYIKIHDLSCLAVARL